MRKKILFALILSCTLNTLFSQIIAGSTAAGLVISNPGVNLNSFLVGQTTNASFDLDCDNIADMKVELYKGATVIDGANEAWLYILNPAFELCSDTGALTLGYSTVRYYNFADPLNCTGAYDWRSDTTFNLGNYGCMICPGPYSITNKYIAYRNTATSQIGWIKISFNLIDWGGATTSIILSINEVLSPCTSTEVEYSATGSDSCGIFNYTYAITSTSCVGTCDGSIQITGLTGGTPTYNYNWAGTPSGDGTSTITGLCNGYYALQISDAVGNVCVAYYSLFVPSSSGITFTITTTNVTCNGASDGTLCCTGVSGGTPPYFYDWGTGSTAPCQTNIPPGTYPFCITDASGCQACTTVVVTEPPPIVVTEIVTNTSCFGCCDGDVQLNAIGGAGAYTTTFTPGSPTPNNFCSGIYNYCVTDANGCSYCDSVVVSFPLGINASDQTKNLFSILPNPSSGLFYLKNTRTISNIEVVNILGEKIYALEVNTANPNIKIDLSNQINGIYFVRIFSEKESFTKKIIISR